MRAERPNILAIMTDQHRASFTRRDVVLPFPARDGALSAAGGAGARRLTGSGATSFSADACT
jgi:hypothetical protein